MQVIVTQDYITTDVYWNKNATIVNSQHVINFDPTYPYTVAQRVADTRRQQYTMKPVRTPKLPPHMEVPLTQDDRILGLYEGLTQLNPMLQRNLGRIVTIQNIAKLMKALRPEQH